MDEAASGPAAVAEKPVDDSEELAACLAAERVILEDMSILLCRIFSVDVNSSQLFRSHERLIE